MVLPLTFTLDMIDDDSKILAVNGHPSKSAVHWGIFDQFIR